MVLPVNQAVRASDRYEVCAAALKSIFGPVIQVRS
jgi:hypothetical protein